MLCGLQGSGKTTTCGKLARLLASQGRKPLLGRRRPPAPRRRRAAQGHRRSSSASRSTARPTPTPVKVCQDAVVEANRQGRDTIILDTAGRLHIDDELMAELEQIEKKVKPHQVFFVCDAMTGQDAVASAEAFNEALELDGVILTKLDGDARGGAALSVRKVTGVPIKFIGVGEKLDKLEPFDPERLVGQMLGMGDIVGLVEAAQSAVDQEEAQRQQEKLAKGKFDLNDFRQQIVQMKKMGSVRELMGKIPGLSQMADRPGRHRRRRRGQADPGDHRQHDPRGAARPAPDRHLPPPPDRRRGGRRAVRRVEPGQAVRRHGRDGQADVADAMLDKIRAMTGLGRAGAFNPGAKLFAPKQRTGKRLSPKEREKLRKEREKEERRNAAASRRTARTRTRPPGPVRRRTPKSDGPTLVRSSKRRPE